MALSVVDRLDLPDPLIAVVGATDHPGKYGGTIYRNLKAKGYRVAAVNPLRDTVDGDPCVPTLMDLAETPDIVNIVVPPTRTMRGARSGQVWRLPPSYRHWPFQRPSRSRWRYASGLRPVRWWSAN